MIFVSLFKGRGKLIKLLEVKCETERTPVQVRYMQVIDDFFFYLYKSV